MRDASGGGGGSSSVHVVAAAAALTYCIMQRPLRAGGGSISDSMGLHIMVCIGVMFWNCKLSKEIESAGRMLHVMSIAACLSAQGCSSSVSWPPTQP